MFVTAPSGSPGAAGVAPAPDASAQPVGGGRFAASPIGQETTPGDRLAVTVLAGLLVASGVGLFVLRWAGRRVRADRRV